MTQIELLERRKEILTRRLERIMAQRKKEVSRLNRLLEEAQMLHQQKEEMMEHSMF